MDKPQNDSFALLIGIDDYSAYDLALSLPGSINDAEAWWRVCRALDVRPESVRVLVTRSPDAKGAGRTSLPTDRFPGAESVTNATRENILAGARWLADNLKGGTIPGILTYSGHGDFTSTGDLALCPTDVEKSGDDVKNLIPYKELGEILAQGDASESLTVVLDCCHAGGADARGAKGDSKQLSLRGKSAAPGVSRPQLGGRMLCAAGVDQIAYQAEFTSRFQGAFTWALTATLLQWKPVSEDGAVRLTISYGEAISVAQKLLSALVFTQAPELLPPSIAALPLLHPGDVVTPGETSEAPDGARVGIQIDPDYFYTIYLGSDNTGPVLAQVVVPNANTTAYLILSNGTNGSVGGPTTAATEYWFFMSSISTRDSTSSYDNIFIESGSLANNNSSNPVTMNANVSTQPLFSSRSSVTWTSSGTTPLPPPTTGATTVFKNTSPAAPVGATVYLLLNVNTTTTGGETTYTYRDVWWYLTGLTSAPSGVNPQSTSSYSRESSGIPTAPYYWAKSRG